MKKAWVLSYPFSAQQRLWLDWVDVQADLSLRWAHSHFVGFVMRRLISFQYGLEMFNTHSDFLEHRTKFGDKKIGLIVLKSCFNNITIARKILNIHEFGLPLNNGKHLDLSNKILGKLTTCVQSILMIINFVNCAKGILLRVNNLQTAKKFWNI